MTTTFSLVGPDVSARKPVSGDGTCRGGQQAVNGAVEPRNSFLLGQFGASAADVPDRIWGHVRTVSCIGG